MFEFDEVVKDIVTEQWVVKADGQIVAEFPEEYLADMHAAGIKETERVKGFEVYVSVELKT